MSRSAPLVMPGSSSVVRWNIINSLASETDTIPTCSTHIVDLLLCEAKEVNVLLPRDIHVNETKKTLSPQAFLEISK